MAVLAESGLQDSSRRILHLKVYISCRISEFSQNLEVNEDILKLSLNRNNVIIVTLKIFIYSHAC